MYPDVFICTHPFTLTLTKVQVKKWVEWVDEKKVEITQFSLEVEWRVKGQSQSISLNVYYVKYFV